MAFQAFLVAICRCLMLLPKAHPSNNFGSSIYSKDNYVAIILMCMTGYCVCNTSTAELHCIG